MDYTWRENGQSGGQLQSSDVQQNKKLNENYIVYNHLFSTKGISARGFFYERRKYLYDPTETKKINYSKALRVKIEHTTPRTQCGVLPTELRIPLLTVTRVLLLAYKWLMAIPVNIYKGVVYMSRASPIRRANSLNEVLITTTTDTQNDISKQNWLSLTVGRA